MGFRQSKGADTPLHGTPIEVLKNAQRISPEAARTFYRDAYAEIGLHVTIPFIPRIPARDFDAFDRFDFWLIPMPDIADDDYPEGFPTLDWGNDAPVRKREQNASCRWVGVEAIQKSHGNTGGGYPNDRLIKMLGRTTRFNTSYEEIKKLYREAARTMGFTTQSVSLPDPWQWNFAASLFLWLRKHRERTTLPQLGATRSWEMCRSDDETKAVTLVGHSDYGGVSAVRRELEFNGRPDVGWRLMIMP